MKRLFLYISIALSALSANAINGTLAGYGNAGYPYQIADKEDLRTMATNVSGNSGNTSASYYILVNDISDVDFCIGNGNVTGFKGNFDGRGHTITLNINNTSNYQGLFTCVDGGTISNVIIDGTITTTGYGVGAVAGQLKNSGIISGCVNRASLTAQSTIGGIVGDFASGRVEDCVNLGEVKSTYNQTGLAYCGGLVGRMGGGATLRNSSVGFSAAISNSNDYYNGVGGLVGYAEAAYNYSAKILNCINYHSIQITATQYQSYSTGFGQLVGSISNTNPYVTIENSFWCALASNSINTQAVGTNATSTNITKNGLDYFFPYGELTNYVARGDWAEEALVSYANEKGFTTWAKELYGEDDFVWHPAYWPVNIEQNEYAAITSDYARAKSGTTITLACTPNNSNHSLLHWEVSYVNDSYNTVNIDLDSNNAFQMTNFGINPIVAHIGEYHSAVAPTCTDIGEEARYYCFLCNKNYEDVQEQTEIAEYRVEALGHEENPCGGTPATCTNDGIKPYIHCSRCNGNFNTDTDRTPIEDIAIPALGHNINLYEGFTGTASNTFPDIYCCSRCRACFANEGLTLAVNKDDYLAYFVGNGTEDMPYEISCQNDFIAISRLIKFFKESFRDFSTGGYYGIPKHFVLTQDIDVDKNFEIINYFAGSIDGQHHYINFNVTKDNWITSLFYIYGEGYKGEYIYPMSCEFKHVNFGGSVKANTSFGSSNFYPFYTVYSGTIEDCHSYVDIDIYNNSGNEIEVFGLVESPSESRPIKNCSNHGNINVTGTSKITIGGLTGGAKCSFMNCYNTGNISAIGGGSGTIVVGGIFSKAMNTASTNHYIENCYNTGNLHAETKSNTNCMVGGITSYISKNKCFIKNCFNSGTIDRISHWSSGFADNKGAAPLAITDYPENITNSYYSNETVETPNGTLVSYTDRDLLTEGGDDVVTLLNANREEGYAEWAYDEDDIPVFAWQVSDINADRKITIADATIMNEVLSGTRTSNRGCIDPDGTHSAASLEAIINRILKK